MPLVKTFQRWFTLNHIGRVEHAYQDRMLDRRHGWRNWIQRRIVDAALIVAIFLALLSIVGLLLWVDVSPFLEAVPLLLIFPLIVAVIVHFGLLIRALAYSSNSIARERQQQSWDLLVLTGVNARQIVMGKWLATVRSLLPAFVRLGLLRACVVIFVGITINNPMTFTASYYGGTLESRLIVPNLFHFTVTLGYILLVTVCNLLFTAACGVSASARHRSAGIALARGIGIRLGIIAVLMLGLIAVVFIMTRTFLYSMNGPMVRLLTEIVMFTFVGIASVLDNGATVGGAYISPRVEYGEDLSYIYRDHIALLVPMVTLVLLYLGLTRLLLGRTVRYLVRQGALPPPSRRTVSQRAPLESTPSPMV